MFAEDRRNEIESARVSSVRSEPRGLCDSEAHAERELITSRLKYAQYAFPGVNMRPICLPNISGTRGVREKSWSNRQHVREMFKRQFRRFYRKIGDESSHMKESEKYLNGIGSYNFFPFYA